MQLTSLYTGYIHDQRHGSAAEYAIDAIWATTANSFEAEGGRCLCPLGPPSRDYDTLLGHGMLLIEMYLMALPGAEPLGASTGTRTARARRRAAPRPRG